MKANGKLLHLKRRAPLRRVARRRTARKRAPSTGANHPGHVLNIHVLQPTVAEHDRSDVPLGDRATLATGPPIATGCRSASPEPTTNRATHAPRRPI